MNVLLVGSGVIGSIYGGQVSLAGHQLWLLAHSDREQQLARQGLRLRDLEQNVTETVKVELSAQADDREYQLVLVAVQAGQLASTFPTLKALKGTPHIILFGNNPEGHAAIPGSIPGTIELAFPGVAGSIEGDTVEYVRISQQPTTLEASAPEPSKTLQTILESRGFQVRRTAHIDGWLAYHAVFISCISMAILNADADTAKLGSDRQQLNFMCRAIEQGFASLKAQHVPGLPSNLALLHHPLLRPIAVRYWGGILRSPKGDLYFGAHLRHAPAEMQMLARWVLEHVAQGHPGTNALQRLINRGD